MFVHLAALVDASVQRLVAQWLLSPGVAHCSSSGLRKPGKDNYSSSRCYGPISLLTAFGKILECIVSQRLSRSLEARGLLSPAQFGFRAGRDTVGMHPSGQ